MTRTKATTSLLAVIAATALAGPVAGEEPASQYSPLAQIRRDNVANLETALNIEPRNPFVRQQLAAAHLQQHLPDQAENQAQRSNSFARGNPSIEVENWRVIAAARQARGDLAGAREARERMAEIQEHLDD